MPVAGSAPLRNIRHEKYSQGRAANLNKKEAYAAAGYAGSAHGGTHMIEKRAGVQDRIAYLMSQVAERSIAVSANSLSVNRNLLSDRFDQVFDRAMEGTPLMAKDGSETGVSKPDLAAANASIIGLAKLHGLSLDVSARVEDLDAELDGKSPEQLQATVLSLLEELDPNMRKKLLAKMSVREAAVGATAEPPGDAEADASGEVPATVQVLQ